MSKIRPEQFGFRPQHSTKVQLVKFIDNIRENMNIKLKTAATLLDIEKSFVKVLHEGLLFKLLVMQVPYQIVSIFNSFVKDTFFCLKIGDSKSTPRLITPGVSQS